MALQGTIDSFPLVDVLQLLATSKKSGRLELVGDRGRGALWVLTGELVAGTVQGRPVTASADAVWELLRFSDGSFEFAADEPPPAKGFDAAGVDETVEQATAMLDEWSQIERRVPSMRHRVELVSDLPGGEVRLSAEDWSIVVGAGPRPMVGDLLGTLGLDEFHGCRRLAEMVDRGLLAVREREGASGPEPAPAIAEPESEPQPGAFTTEPSPGSSDVPLSEQFPDGAPVAVDPAPSLLEPVPPVAAAAPELSTEASVDHDAGRGSAFPDHFPIDDLVGESTAGGDWDDAAPSPGMVHAETPAWAEHAPILPAEAFAGESPDTEGEHGAAETGPDVPQPAAAPMAENDVLAQIGRLSPKAAEAIAAALGDGDDRGASG